MNNEFFLIAKPLINQSTNHPINNSLSIALVFFAEIQQCAANIATVRNAPASVKKRRKRKKKKRRAKSRAEVMPLCGAIGLSAYKFR